MTSQKMDVVLVTSSYLMSRSQVWHLKHPNFSTHGLVTSTGPGTPMGMFFHMGHGNHEHGESHKTPKKRTNFERDVDGIFLTGA